MKQTTPTKTKMPKLNGLQTLNAKYNDYGYEFIKISHGDARIMFDGEVVLATRARNYIQEMTDAMKSCPWLFYSMYNESECELTCAVNPSGARSQRLSLDEVLTLLAEPVEAVEEVVESEVAAVEIQDIWTKLGHFNNVAFWMLNGQQCQTVSNQIETTSFEKAHTTAQSGVILDKEATKEFQSGLALQP